VTTSYENIQIRRGSSEDFDQANPILRSGEPAFTIDDGIFKIGDGETRWNDLKSVGDGNNSSSIIRYSYLLNATPAIEAHSSFILTVDAPSVLESKKYSILTSPSRAFYDGMVIAYAYVSADDEISIVLTNGHSKNIPFENASLIINVAIILMDEFGALIDGPTILDPSVPTTTTTSGPTTTSAPTTTTTSAPTTTTTSGPTTTTTSGPTTTTTTGPTTTTTFSPTTTTTSGPTTTTTTAIPSRAITFAAYGRTTLTYTHPLYNSTSKLDVGPVNVGTSSNPSYYGTYDQDGNIYELIEDFNNWPLSSAYVDNDNSRFALGGDVFSENGFERHNAGTSLAPNMVYTYFNKIPRSLISFKPLGNTITLANKPPYYGLRLVRDTAPPTNELNLWCRVGNESNPSDRTVRYVSVSSGSRSNTRIDAYLFDRATRDGIGSVNYEYWIKKVPVTYSEFVTYLNLVDPNGVYSSNLRYCIIGMQLVGTSLTVPVDSSSNDGTVTPRGNYLLYDNTRAVGNRYYVNAYHLNKPVYSLNWIHAARYCNWISNGKGTADTENGAYDLRRNEELTFNITRQSASVAAIPTLNEWYKAAYYNPNTATYYVFATQSNRLPQTCSQNISTGDGIINLTKNSLYVNYPTMP
jgi:formylglycine-generating enzyme required for sulfatase activity